MLAQNQYNQFNQQEQYDQQQQYYEQQHYEQQQYEQQQYEQQQYEQQQQHAQQGYDQQGGYQLGGYEQQGGYQQQQQQQQQQEIDYEAYRAFVREQAETHDLEGYTEDDLWRRFQAMQSYAHMMSAYDGGRSQFLREQDNGVQGYYKGGAYAYAPQREARLSRTRGLFGEPTQLQEFLRFQEWYVKYCKLRGIGQHAYR